jgi:hypothetical protein
MGLADMHSGVTPGTTPGAVERLAWRIPLSTRRLFLGLALASAAALATSGLAAAWVASRNTATIASARDTGLGVASAATEFRTSLGAAQAEAAATLLSGGLEDPARRQRYDRELDQASGALTTAAFLATDDDAATVTELSDGLVAFVGLVETARANSRQGFPVGAAYFNQARGLAQDDLAPRADQLRRTGEQLVARAANQVAGPFGIGAIAALALGLAVLGACSIVAAGRTRRVLHPALIAATFAAAGALVVVSAALLAQSRELRAAATDDIEAYVAANNRANTLSNLRVTEIAAVAARGSGGPLYDQFEEDASQLASSLGEDSADAGVLPAVEEYVTAVEQVETTDLDGDNREAAQIPLEGESATSFIRANDAATEALERTGADLADRFASAADTGVEPLIPAALGLVAGGLAVAGILVRARRYR